MLNNKYNQKRNLLITILVVIVAVAIIVGSLRWYVNIKKVPDVSSVPAIKPVLTITSDFAGWKTYADATYKYIFRYPDDLELTTSSAKTETSDGTIYPGITVRLQGKEKCTLAVGSGDHCFVIDFTFSKYYGDSKTREKYTSRKIGDLTYSYRNVLDNKDVDGKLIEGENTRIDQYFYEQTNQQLFLTISYRISADDKTSFDSLFDQILSTLKFTN